jgi:hypothetical protein
MISYWVWNWVLKPTAVMRAPGPARPSAKDGRVPREISGP